MAKSAKNYRVGSLHWRRGIQHLDEVLDLSTNNDTLVFPGRIYEINKQMPLHKSLSLQGKNGSILLISSRKNQKKSFYRPGFMIPGEQIITYKNLTIEIEPDTYGIDLPSTFQGAVALDNVTIRQKKRILYRDNHVFSPAIKAKGKGTLVINNSMLDFITIDAPEMTIQIKQSHIGSFDQQSLIRAGKIEIINSEINNTVVSSNKARLADITTYGGLGLQGKIRAVRTGLLPLNAPQPNQYPKALTYIVVLPKSRISIEDVLSEVPDGPPYYRHFDIRESQVKITGAIGLSDQLLSSISTRSTVQSDGDRWIKDPTQKQLQKELRPLNIT